MSTINNYQLFCVSEQAIKNTYGIEEPTTCPTDTAHTIDTNSIRIVHTISENKTIIEQPSAGRYMVEGIHFEIPSCSPVCDCVLEHVFDIEVLLWTTGFNCTADMVGDQFDVILNPDTVVGGLTATGNTSATILNVNSTVTGNVTPGMYLTLTNTSANPPITQELGKVLEVSVENGTVTISNALESTFPPGSIITLVLYMARNILLDYAGPVSLSEKGFSGKIIPAGTVLQMIYTNNSGIAKGFNWKISYYYGADFSLL